MNNTYALDRTDFEVYFEGVPIEFNSFNIQETSGGFPQASITVPYSKDMIHILPHTIVQIFGPDIDAGRKMVLMFEGNISSQSYQKGSKQRMIQFSCSHLLAQWQRIKLRPKDALIPPRASNAEGAAQDESVYVESNAVQSMPQVLKIGLKAVIPQVGGDTLKESLKEVSMSKAGGVYDELIQLLDSDKVAAGDLSPVLDYFEIKFAENDIFWGIQAAAYDVVPSTTILPNPDKMGMFKNKLVAEQFRNIAKDLRGSFQRGDITFIDVLMTLLSTIFYMFQIPAMPIAMPAFRKTNYSEDTLPIPLRALFTPSLKHAPPPKCNIFFPNQYTDLSFSRNFTTEPTRAIGSYKLPVQNSLEGYKGIWPFTVYPKRAFDDSDAKNNQLNLTAEETYRGINPVSDNYSSMLSGAALNALDKEMKGAVPDTDVGKNFDEALYKETLQELTANTFLNKRLEQRQASLSADWSPYRLTGYPAAVLDEEYMIYGTIASQNFSVSASGQAVCSITLGNVRWLDYRVTDPEEASDEPYMDLDTLEPIVDINHFLYHDKLYGFNHAGTELYPFLMRGRFPKEGEMKSLIDNGKAFSGVKTAAKQICTLEPNDDSLLSWFNPNLAPTVEKENSPTVQLKIAGREALREYEAREEIGNNHRWAIGVNKRNLIFKETYFNELGIAYPDLTPDMDIFTFDSVNLLSGKGQLRKVKEVAIEHDPKAQKEFKTDFETEERNFRQVLSNWVSATQGQLARLSGEKKAKLLAQYQAIISKSPQEDLKWDLTPLLDNPIADDEMNDYYSQVTGVRAAQDEYVKAVETYRDKTSQKYRTEYKLPKSLEVDFKKPYNLTRQLHVKRAMKNFIKVSQTNNFNVNIVK